MQVKVKLKDVIRTHNVLNIAGSKSFNVRIAYAIAKNRQKLQREIDALTEEGKPSDAYRAYEKERLALAKANSKKDEKGHPITKMTPGGEVFVMEDQAKYDVLFEELNEKHKKVLEEYEDKIKQREEMLNDEITLDLHVVKLSDFTDTMSVNEMDAFSMFILDEEKPEENLNNIESDLVVRIQKKVEEQSKQS